MKMLLQHQGVWQAAQGKDGELDAVKKQLSEDKAFGTIGLTIDQDQVVIPTRIKTAAGLWNYLATTYEPKNSLRILHLKRQYHETRQCNFNSMQTYINKLEECTSLLADAGQPVTDEDQAWTMLAGLPSSKDTLVMGYTSSLGDAKLAKDKVKELLLFEDVGYVVKLTIETKSMIKISLAQQCLQFPQAESQQNQIKRVNWG